jgi:heme exporter protein B
MRVVRQAVLLLRSELRQELRDFELLLSAGFFTLVLLAMFYLSFASLPTRHSLPAVPAMLWLTIAFVGVLTLTRAFDREREADTLRALLAAPVDRLAIYLAKAALSLLVLMICCLVLVPGLWLMFPAGAAFAEQPGAHRPAGVARLRRLRRGRHPVRRRPGHRRRQEHAALSSSSTR